MKHDLLKLWKIRQEAEGHDVSGVTTLEEAEHFFDKERKVAPVQPPKAEVKKPEAKKPTAKKSVAKKPAKKTTAKKKEV